MSNVDLNFVIAFLRTHCTTAACNPLSLMSATELVRNLPAEHLAAFEQGLAGVLLHPSVAALIAGKMGEIEMRKAA